MRFVALLIAILGAGVASAAQGEASRPVRMTLESVNPTNSPWQTDFGAPRQAVVFLVTNGGAKPVLLMSCGASSVPTNGLGSPGVLSICWVPPFTNSTLAVLWKPGKAGAQRLRYAVYEPPDVLWKAATTARALVNGALSGGLFTNIWASTNRWIEAYQITSPPFTGLSEPLLPPGNGRLPGWVWPTNGWIRPAEIDPSLPAGEASPAWRALDPISDEGPSNEPAGPQPVRAASGSQPLGADTNRTPSTAGSRR